MSSGAFEEIEGYQGQSPNSLERVASSLICLELSAVAVTTVWLSRASSRAFL